MTNILPYHDPIECPRCFREIQPVVTDSDPHCPVCKSEVEL